MAARLLVALLLLSPAAGAGVLASPLGDPCACPETPPADVAMARAAVVFVGKVEGMHPHFGRQRRQLWTQVHLEILGVWKGELSSRVVLATDIVGLCGYPFSPGGVYLVYADAPSRAGVEYETDGCSRTRPIAEAQADLELFRSWRRAAQAASASAPEQAAAPAPPSPRPSSPASTAGPASRGPAPTPRARRRPGPSGSALARDLGTLYQTARSGQPVKRLPVVLHTPDGGERQVLVSAVLIPGDAKRDAIVTLVIEELAAEGPSP